MERQARTHTCTHMRTSVDTHVCTRYTACRPEPHMPVLGWKVVLSRRCVCGRVGVCVCACVCACVCVQEKLLSRALDAIMPTYKDILTQVRASHTHTRMHALSHTHTCMHALTHTHTRARVHALTYTYTKAQAPKQRMFINRMCVCVPVYVMCVCVRVCACVCVRQVKALGFSEVQVHEPALVTEDGTHLLPFFKKVCVCVYRRTSVCWGRRASPAWTWSPTSTRCTHTRTHTHTLVCCLCISCL